MFKFNRRKFLALSAASGLSAALSPTVNFASAQMHNTSPLRISLAQWSLHRAYGNNSLKPQNFAADAKNMFNINAVEYVADFYKEQKNQASFWKKMNTLASDNGVTNLLIMVDGEGELGSSLDMERKTAVENHFPWVEAAHEMGCHSIRVNAFGKGTDTQIKRALVDGLGRLTEFSAQAGINILIENHGLQSSNAAFIVDVIKKVDNPYLGTLPDFGNWCLSKEWGGTENNSCPYIYDPYRGVAEFMPFAKGVSAKAYAFGADGNETQMDYRRLLEIVRDSGFNGHIGIEYEGQALGEIDGIKATHKLLQETWNTL